MMDMSRGDHSLIQFVMWCRTTVWHCRLPRGAGPLIDSFCMLVIDHCMSRVVGTQCDMSLFFHGCRCIGDIPIHCCMAQGLHSVWCLSFVQEVHLLLQIRFCIARSLGAVGALLGSLSLRFVSSLA